MVKVKICGLWRPADIEAANEAVPDYVGFVFAESRRHVTPEQALALRGRLSPSIVPVGVFVDEDIGIIIDVVRNGVIDAVQLHGSESEAYIRKLKALTDRPVIKALAVLGEGDAQAWRGSAADYLLLDSKGGGSGQSFDWRLIGRPEKPFFLAGGLDPDNIVAALDAVCVGSGDRLRAAGGMDEARLYAVDASSGVETGGYKDPGKMRDFVKKVRNYAKR
jgi:phosphoribosylanthranilate isomerase